MYNPVVLFTFYVCMWLYAMGPTTMSFTAQVGQLREISNKAQNAELKLFLEVEFGLVMICWNCASFLLCMFLFCSLCDLDAGCLTII
jgi:hypothetical protein